MEPDGSVYTPENGNRADDEQNKNVDGCDDVCIEKSMDEIGLLLFA